MVKKKGNGFFARASGRNRSIGEIAADALARWAGSWGFIIGFIIFFSIWMALNVFAWVGEWDPYPFILLNLFLSFVAALQAPVILMSQNRQGQKDRAKIEYDYRIDRRAEKMIEEVLEILKKRKRVSRKK